MNTAEKGNSEVLAWISATNNLTGVVKMHELPQFVVKSISRVQWTKCISKNFWRLDFGTELQSFRNICNIFLKKVREKAKKWKIQNSLTISISHTLEFIWAKFDVIWVVFEDVVLFSSYHFILIALNACVHCQISLKFESWLNL